MEDLGTLGKGLPRIHPQPPEGELFMEDLGISGKCFPRISPPPWNFSWRNLEDFVQGTDVWRLIVVSPADTVSLGRCEQVTVYNDKHKIALNKIPQNTCSIELTR